jgi:predicted PurR-regulated permease PerM
VERFKTSDYLRFAVVFFGVLVVLRFLWFTKSVVLIAILAILFGVTLSRGVDYLEKIHIKRAFGTLLILLVAIGTIVGVGFAIAPSISEQMGELKTKMPQAIKQFEARLRKTPLASAALQAATQTPQGQSSSQPQQQEQKEPQQKPPDQPQQQPPQKPPDPKQQQQPPQQQEQQQQKKPEASGAVQAFSKMLFPFLTNSIAAIAGLVLVLFLAAYFAVDPGLYRRGIMRLVPPKRRKRADELFEELSAILRQWFLARLLAMVAVGIITGVALAFLKIPAAGALGLIAGLLEFVPFVGPIAAAIPAVAMALIVSPEKAVYVIILFVILQQLEGNVITPLLMKNRLDVPPAVTILAVSALGIVFGIVGMLVAEPLSAVLIVAIRELYVDRIEAT